MTLSAYLEVSHCSPVLFSSDLISPVMSTQLTHLLSPLDSWTIASSLLLLPKTSAWSSTPEMQRFPLPVPSGTSLGADTPKLQTGETSNNTFFYDSWIMFYGQSLHKLNGLFFITAIGSLASMS